ncbi:hypothetical protein Pelo_12888 [Pelomyxa schiedti]|nr:hypothetical protein Pelo_12888 [Pelomyxa schiedti]
MLVANQPTSSSFGDSFAFQRVDPRFFSQPHDPGSFFLAGTPMKFTGVSCTPAKEAPRLQSTPSLASILLGSQLTYNSPRKDSFVQEEPVTVEFLPSSRPQTEEAILNASESTTRIGPEGDTALISSITRGDNAAVTKILQQVTGNSFAPTELPTNLNSILPDIQNMTLNTYPEHQTQTFATSDRTNWPSHHEVNRQNYIGNTPLLTACTFSNVDVCAMLLAAGADPNIPNIDGVTPLHIAAANRNENIIKMLLQNGAFINAQVPFYPFCPELTSTSQDENGDTPLHWGVREDCSLHTSRMLLACGASPQIVNNDGQNCFQLALELGHTNLPGFVMTLRTRNTPAAAGDTTAGGVHNDLIGSSEVSASPSLNLSASFGLHGKTSDYCPSDGDEDEYLGDDQ